jgi:hypothetical protein
VALSKRRTDVVEGKKKSMHLIPHRKNKNYPLDKGPRKKDTPPNTGLPSHTPYSQKESRMEEKVL